MAVWYVAGVGTDMIDYDQFFFFDKRFFVSGQCEFSCSAANYPAEVVTSSRLPGILMVDHGAPPVMRSIRV